jgi:hypothetical protein
MKSLVKFGVILIGLWISSNAEVWGANWKLYAFDVEKTFFYDGDSVSISSKSYDWQVVKEIVKVVTKENFTSKGVMRTVKEFGKKYEKLSIRESLMEINCVDKMYRVLSSSFYAQGGEVIFSSSSPENWQAIVPKSAGDELYKAVCK